MSKLIEDALALMQMSGAATWAVLGTSGFANFTVPSVVKTLILAPDADPAGDAAVVSCDITNIRVLHLRPPESRDWCDLLASFEESAAIREHDGGETRSEAELAAFAETIGGRLSDA